NRLCRRRRAGHARGIDGLRRARGRSRRTPLRRGLAPFLRQDAVTDVDAIVADEDAWAGDELRHIMLRLVAKGAPQGPGAAAQAGRRAADPAFESHGILPLSSLP